MTTDLPADISGRLRAGDCASGQRSHSTSLLNQEASRVTIQPSGAVMTTALTLPTEAAALATAQSVEPDWKPAGVVALTILVGLTEHGVDYRLITGGGLGQQAGAHIIHGAAAAFPVTTDGEAQR